jgi:pimeloyl-ACP methyl ester carboxylesterase
MKKLNTLFTRGKTLSANGSTIRQQQYHLSFSTIGKTESNKSPLVVLHGLLGNKNLWKGVLQRREGGILSNDDRCAYLLDARNHGESFHHPVMNYETMANDLEQFIIQRKLKKVILLGHSMGGKTIMTLCMNRALNRSLLTSEYEIERVIIVDIAPASYLDNEKWTIPQVLKAMDQLPMDFTPEYKTRKHVDSFLSNYISDLRMRQFIGTNLTRREDGTGWKWIHNHDIIRNSVQEMGSFPNIELSSPQQRYNGKMLFIRGGESFYCASPYDKEIDRLFSNYQMVTIAGAGHWVHADKTDDFSNAVSHFINNMDSEPIR